MLQEDEKNLRQILVDIPRTAPNLPLFHSDVVRKALERVLYVWSVRHPASGYVQGMDDLVVPFYTTFLSCALDVPMSELNAVDVETVDVNVLTHVEADCYWCFTKLVDSIQDHYVVSQPGIQRMVYKLECVVERIDKPLWIHLVEKSQLPFIQFSFRWMNCLLMRELSLETVVRLWDTYFSEDASDGGGFDAFHVYVCASLLVSFSEDLQTMNLEELLMFLQRLPTREWNTDRVEAVLSQAYILKSLFQDAEAHLM